MCTPMPPMSSPRTSHSPVCNPARTSMPSPCTASRIAMAQRIARCGPSNIARKPSPDAVFGAPVALEDHAFRACLAALAIQEEANGLGTEVQRRDGVDLRLRVGLNSGQVIAGEIGSGALGYAAIGERVGMAQRMESVASPGERVWFRASDLAAAGS